MTKRIPIVAALLALALLSCKKQDEKPHLEQVSSVTEFVNNQTSTTTEYTYNAAGHLVQSETSYRGSELKTVNEYTYDAKGRLIQKKLQILAGQIQGSLNAYQYNEAGQLLQIRQRSMGTDTATRVTRFGYNGGQLVYVSRSLAYPALVMDRGPEDSLVFAYSAGRPSSCQHYGYSNVPYNEMRRYPMVATTRQDYQYDSLNRLIGYILFWPPSGFTQNAFYWVGDGLPATAQQALQIWAQTQTDRFLMPLDPFGPLVGYALAFSEAKVIPTGTFEYQNPYTVTRTEVAQGFSYKFLKNNSPAGTYLVIRTVRK